MMPILKSSFGSGKFYHYSISFLKQLFPLLTLLQTVPKLGKLPFVHFQGVQIHLLLATKDLFQPENCNFGFRLGQEYFQLYLGENRKNAFNGTALTLTKNRKLMPYSSARKLFFLAEQISNKVLHYHSILCCNS